MAETKTTKKVAEEKTTKATTAKTTKSTTTTTTKTTKATTTKKVAAPVEEVKEVKNAPKKATKGSKKTLRVTLVKSTIACKPNQVKTIKALGLNKLNSHNDLVDNAAIRGMIFTVKHLVKVEEI